MIKSKAREKEVESMSDDYLKIVSDTWENESNSIQDDPPSVSKYINNKSKPIHKIIKIIVVGVVVPSFTHFVTMYSDVEGYGYDTIEGAFLLVSAGVLLSWLFLNLYDNIVLKKDLSVTSQVVRNSEISKNNAEDIAEMRELLEQLKQLILHDKGYVYYDDSERVYNVLKDTITKEDIDGY